MKFQPATVSKWTIWPQVMIDYPTIQKDISSPSPPILWQARQANISYSLLHPSSISIHLDGEQLICTFDNSNQCFQIHSTTWNIYTPILGKSSQSSFSLQCDDIFYTSPSLSSEIIQSLQFKNLRSQLHWNVQTTPQESLAFLTLDIQEITATITNLPSQKLQNTHIQAALVQESNHLYKLLVQNADLSWNHLSINSTGKFYLPLPQILPTGELSLYLNGINQAIYEQLSFLKCCAKLQQELSQTSLPSQIHLTLLIRDGVLYLGAIPLHANWYNDLKMLIDHYTK
ncbi:DUF2125 domain-containing protein [Commensalibacter nepenthis]|uniref:Urease accessory protein UreD n=1 Tax=Commensalibacter nepenthis TaxID=3043872 RepID=A0ABT6Q7K6_9PROT|nr:DUF2125 domain-containing protein [Commensalibacter sp. TBRC 10068]MDI2112350.1 hypothetical protein [Commensalibacter sp. TBRC 10068]